MSRQVNASRQSYRSATLRAYIVHDLVLKVRTQPLPQRLGDLAPSHKLSQGVVNSLVLGGLAVNRRCQGTDTTHNRGEQHGTDEHHH